MSFFSNPIANISGGIHDLGKGISNVTKNPLVDMAAAAALDYFVPGLAETTGLSSLGITSNAAAAGIITGGISGLASGNLAQGLMAGMAGYGGANLGEDLNMGHFNTPTTYGPGDAGTDEMWSKANAQAPAGSVKVPSNVADFSNQYANANVGDFNPPTNVYAGNPAITPGGGYNYNLGPDGMPLSQTATQMPTAPASAPASAANTIADTAGKKAVTDEAKKSLFDKFTGLPWYEQAAIGAGGLSLLKAAAQPQKMNMPNSPNTQFIRYSSYSPMGGYTHQGMAPAAATGGLVALAHGGRIHHYDDGGDVAAAPAYTNEQIANYVTSNNLSGNALTAAEQQYGVSDAQVQAALAAQSAPSVGAPAVGGGAPAVSAAPVVNAAPAYNNYTGQQMADYIAQNNINTSDPAALAAAEAATNADPAAVQKFLASGINPYSAVSLANPTQSKVSSFDALLGTSPATTEIKNAVYAAQMAAGVPSGTSNSIAANTQIANEMDNWNVNPTAMANALGMTPDAIQALYNQVDPHGKFSTLPQVKTITNVINTPGGGGGTGAVSYTHLTLPTNREV